MSDLKKLYLDLHMLGVFNALLDKPLLRHFDRIFRAEDDVDAIEAYAAFVSEIYRFAGSLSELVKCIVFEDENPYIRIIAGGGEPSAEMSEAVKYELSVLSAFASLRSEDFKESVPSDFLLPFASEPCDLFAEYQERVQNVHKYGFGIFSSHPMFRLDDKGEICPIPSYDTVALDSFVGYESERSAVVENTRALVEGRPCANLLLFGDAGTGKSSTVKAVVNHFYSDGIRLIEVRKDQLTFLPYIMGRIVDNPLKFIIFIDDLSFNKNDDCFSMLKAALEGSASVRSENSLIYATSNRRHIVKETFDDREGGDVHRNDTMQEKISLSDRFGLTVWFGKPSKQLYLDIVHTLAAREGINISSAELDMRAEEFALRRGNRSPRCAEQFVKSII